MPAVPTMMGSPQELEVVGDVPGAAAKVPAHFGYREGHVQHVHLIGKDVRLEAILKDHDGIKGQGTADDGGHGISLLGFVKKDRELW